MSTFAVTTEVVEKIWDHPNADRLQLAKLAGMDYQFVIPKDKYSEGQLVFFFPVDSLMPAYLLEYIGLTGKLSGKDKNRVKTIKLRGEFSVGLIAAPDELGMMTPTEVGLDFTEKLGVTKYEPPEFISKNAKTSSLPPELHVYDIESCERWPDVVEALMDIPVMITEKLEGSNYAALLRKDGSFVVCTRRQSVEELEGQTHIWWEVTRRQNIKEFCEDITYRYGMLPQTVTVRGELIGPGIQGNIYGLNKHELRIFDIEIDGTPVDAQQYLELMEGRPDYVPELCIGKTLRESLGGETTKQASTDKSILAPDKLREGIVIRPMTEQTYPKLGRVILKQRSPEYLLKSDT